MELKTKIKGVKVIDLGKWIYYNSPEVARLGWDERRTIKYLKIVLVSLALTKPSKAQSLTCGDVLKAYDKELRKTKNDSN